MPSIIIASLHPHAGRTAATVGLGARLADEGRAVRLLRVRSAEGSDPAAEDDAQMLALAPGCSAPNGAVTEQDALAEVRQAGDSAVLIEPPAGEPAGLATRLSARVILITSDAGESALNELASTASGLGAALAGVLVLRRPERILEDTAAAVRERGLACFGVLPEDRLLAGPSPDEMAETLHASTLVPGEGAEEAVEFVMLGPVSSDPGQPYFLQHGAKAVVNRFDKMDLHLAALATEPACLILTGGQQPSTYLTDRVAGIEPPLPVLLSPEGTVRTIELIDALYGGTRFSGRRKLERAIELFERYVDAAKLREAIG